MRAEFSREDLRFRDALLVIPYAGHNFAFPPSMDDNLYEYRYEQRGDTYQLRCWHNGSERTRSGLTYDMPEWLRAVLDTAKVAGAIRVVKSPPPDVILWFRTDATNHLTEFIEMT